MVPEHFVAAIGAGGSVVLSAPDLDTWLRFFGRLHPAIVHFPIALILTAALVEFVCSFRGGHRLSRVGFTCLVLGAVTGGLAAWFGWLNADFEPHSASLAETLLFHRWIGVAAASIAGIGLIMGIVTRFSKVHWPAMSYRLALMLCVVTLAAGGYLGGELVHGQRYLLAVFDTPEPAPAQATRPPSGEAQEVLASEPPTATTVSFATDVHPIIEARCAECHGPDRRRGNLTLEPITDAFTGDRAAWVIVPGAPDRSELVERIRLPADDPDRMPKRGDPLSADQIATIERWIAQGALLDDAPPATADSDEAPPAAESADDAPPVAESTAADVAARDQAVAAIESRGGSAVPLAAGAPELDVNLSLAEPPVTDDDLSLLEGVEPLVVRLSLSGAAITDAALQRVARCAHLQQLRLDGTAITDAGVAALGALDRLESLNLYGTAVTDAGVEQLVAALPALRTVYLWQTPVTDEAVARLAEKRPDLEIVRGTAPPDDG